MSWFDRLPPFRKGGSALAEAIRNKEVNGSTRSSPPLMCLVSDASGRASFKTHVFADSESATEFVRYWFPNQSEGGLIAFWAITYEPPLDASSDNAAEPLVMVRDLSRDSVVYLFSFTDIESAQAFLRDEVQHGTDLAAMMLYWAVPVRMAADPSGKMRLTPALPPGAAQSEEPEAPAVDMWTLPPALLTIETQQQEPAEDSRTIFEEATNARTGVADPESAADETFQLTAWMERARRKPSVDSEAAVVAAAPVYAGASRKRARARLEHAHIDGEMVWPAQTSQSEEPAARPGAILEQAPANEAKPYSSVEPSAVVEHAAAVSQASEAPPAVEKEGDEPAPVAEPAPALNGRSEDTPEEPVVIEAVAGGATPVAPVAEEATRPDEVAIASAESTIDEVATIRIQTNGNGNGHSADPDHHENGHVIIPAEIVVHQNGHSKGKPAEVDSDAAPETTTQPEAKAADGANGQADHGVDIRIDIRLESARAMKVKRWDVKEGPFEGFNSPPGRF